MSEKIQLHPDTLHTAEQFYAFFAMIPEDQWGTGTTDCGGGKHCAVGHLHEGDQLYGPIATRLWNILGHGAWIINDGISDSYQQPTPKARILAALRDKFTTSLT